MTQLLTDSKLTTRSGVFSYEMCCQMLAVDCSRQQLTSCMVANVCVVWVGDPECGGVVVSDEHAIGHLHSGTKAVRHPIPGETADDESADGASIACLLARQRHKCCRVPCTDFMCHWWRSDETHLSKEAAVPLKHIAGLNTICGCSWKAKCSILKQEQGQARHNMCQ